MTVKRDLAIGALLACGVALLPFTVQSGAVLNAVILTLFAALLGQAWNVLAGFGGQFSFGHAVFFGTGAYASAVLQIRFGVNAWAALALAVVAGAAVGAIIGVLTFRYQLRGSYFALVTLAFAEVFRILAHRCQRNLVGSECSLDRYAVHNFRSSPSFRRTQDDHWPYRSIGEAGSACVALDVANLFVTPVQRGCKLLMDLHGVVSGNQKRRVPVAAEEAGQFVFRNAGVDSGAGYFVPV